MRVLMVLAALFVAVPAQARSLDDCASAWSRAVRSYLTQNRRAAPDGSTPSDLDGEELAAQAWIDAFRPACELEATGDKPAARVEAAAIGVRILADLDPKGCESFLAVYMESTRSRDICAAASAGANADLSSQIAQTIPARY